MANVDAGPVWWASVVGDDDIMGIFQKLGSLWLSYHGIYPSLSLGCLTLATVLLGARTQRGDLG